MAKIILNLTNEQYKAYRDALEDPIFHALMNETLGGITLKVGISPLWDSLILTTYKEVDLGEIDVTFED